MILFFFWQCWMRLLNAIVFAFGIEMAVLNGTPLFDLLNHQIAATFRSAQRLPAEAQ
jgi:hypothetical protein